MKQKDTLVRKKKKQRIQISNLDDLMSVLKEEGYPICEGKKENSIEEIAMRLQVEDTVIEYLYTSMRQDGIIYRANNTKELVNYIETIILFEKEHTRLGEQLSSIKTLIIDRVEYDRLPQVQEEVSELEKDIKKLAREISAPCSNEERGSLEKLEEEIHTRYIYAKDIELLKKMVIVTKRDIVETYDEQSKTKTIVIPVPKELNHDYFPARKGSVEYYTHLQQSMPRIRRLNRNLYKYMQLVDEDNTVVRINQSEVLQDSINIALARFHDKEVKAISGSDEIASYCKAPSLEHAIFQSRKVNKLGKLGIGYDRVNDSEKKILEEIHKQIEDKTLPNDGTIMLYSKWEPCLSCYFVMAQFLKRHPNIRIQVKYSKRYGER